MAKIRLKPRWTKERIEERRLNGASSGTTSANDTELTKDRQEQVGSTLSAALPGCRQSSKLAKRQKKQKVKKKYRMRDQRYQQADSVEDARKLKRQRALQYLHDWHSSRDRWRFDGKMQAWLINNMYDSEAVTDEEFAIVIDYLEDLKGATRNDTALTADKVFKECELQLGGLSDSDGPESSSALDGKRTAYDRSRQIIQLLV